MDNKYYCPRCGNQIPKPIQKYNPKGFVYQSDCPKCNCRVISDSLDNFIISKWSFGSK